MRPRRTKRDLRCRTGSPGLTTGGASPPTSTGIRSPARAGAGVDSPPPQAMWARRGRTAVPGVGIWRRRIGCGQGEARRSRQTRLDVAAGRVEVLGGEDEAAVRLQGRGGGVRRRLVPPRERSASRRELSGRAADGRTRRTGGRRCLLKLDHDRGDDREHDAEAAHEKIAGPEGHKRPSKVAAVVLVVVTLVASGVLAFVIARNRTPVHRRHPVNGADIDVADALRWARARVGLRAAGAALQRFCCTRLVARSHQARHVSSGTYGM